MKRELENTYKINTLKSIQKLGFNLLHHRGLSSEIKDIFQNNINQTNIVLDLTKQYSNFNPDNLEFIKREELGRCEPYVSSDYPILNDYGNKKEKVNIFTQVNPEDNRQYFSVN